MQTTFPSSSAAGATSRSVRPHSSQRAVMPEPQKDVGGGDDVPRRAVAPEGDDRHVGTDRLTLGLVDGVPHAQDLGALDLKVQAVDLETIALVLAELVQVALGL